MLEISHWVMLHGPAEVDSNQIETLIEKNQCYTTGEMANTLKLSKSSIENHLHQLGYVNCFNVWVLHKLSGKKKKEPLDPTSACDSLLKHKANVPFLKQIVMGDENWILYNNVEPEEVVGQVKWITTNHTKGQSSSKEGDAVYMMGMEGRPLLWAPSGKPNDWCQQLLLPIRATESSTLRKVSGISQQKMRSVPSG